MKKIIIGISLFVLGMVVCIFGIISYTRHHQAPICYTMVPEQHQEPKLIFPTAKECIKFASVDNKLWQPWTTMPDIQQKSQPLMILVVSESDHGDVFIPDVQNNIKWANPIPYTKSFDCWFWRPLKRDNKNVIFEQPKIHNSVKITSKCCL
jgi:hypothetical protein